ncbi:restriction endonuclease subunit S [Enterococcus hirae]|uniref:restriction endonuclease subunit S n=1 Tax=Enterococcus hirae TaxID=1354 RepID=UPI0009BE7572|nr:restriction endonuclease subunit S [Enterococcus hirae]EMF0076320.1 restriction endonuclease subunit S [Enterococcus hirae]EMF0131133.1 restriction endonuclease subunit S [Enterococcus hirae]EMF0517377.1 restriction endonuclease subunit S [Enterococcus hirae]OQO44103.1 hypothetical protein BH733_12770 [Enterococcus hirae]
MSPNEKGSDTDVNTNSVLPYISARKKNNGLKEFLPYTKNKIQKNSLTWNKIGDGGAGLAYYHPYDYLVDSINVVVLYPKPKMNPYIGLFLSTLLSMYKDVFNHGHTLSKRRFNTAKIKVPVTPQKSLNWDYMEQYIVNIMKTIEIPELEPIKSSNVALNSVNWLPVQLGELFIPRRGNSGPKNKLKPGNTVLISAKKTDNGFDSMVTPPEKSTIYSNTLTVNNNGDGGAGIAYYHPYKFIATQDVTLLIPKFKLSKYSKIFISLAISSQRTGMGFGFGNKLNSSRLERLSIMLPVKLDKSPNWEFMEDYIKSISNSYLI